MSSSSSSIGATEPPFLPSNASWVEKSLGLGRQASEANALSRLTAEIELEKIDIAKENIRRVVGLLRRVMVVEEDGETTVNRFRDLGDRSDSANGDLENASVWSLLRYLEEQVDAFTGNISYTDMLAAAISEMKLLWSILFGDVRPYRLLNTNKAVVGNSYTDFSWEKEVVPQPGLDPHIAGTLNRITNIEPNLTPVPGIIGNVKYLLEHSGSNADLANKVEKLEDTVGNPFYPQDGGYSDIVTNNTIFNFLEFLYYRISGLQERTFQTTIRAQQVTKAALPLNTLINPPSAFQGAFIVESQAPGVIITFTLTITIPTSSAPLPANWFWTLYDGTDIALQSYQPLSQLTKTIRWEPSEFNISNQLRLLLSTDTDFADASDVDVRFSGTVDWNIIAQLNASSFPNHLLKSDFYGDRNFLAAEVVKGTIFATQAAADADTSETDQKYVVDQNYPIAIPATYKEVWFQSPKSQTYREISLDIYFRYTTTSPYSVPLLASFIFTAEDYAGHVLKTYHWIHPIKFVKGNVADTSDWVFPFHLTDIDENMERLVFKPHFDFFTSVGGAVSGSMWSSEILERDDVNYVANWQMKIRMDMTFRAVDNSIIEVRKNQIERTAVGEGRGFTITCGVETYDNIKLSVGNLSVAFSGAKPFFNNYTTSETCYLQCGYRPSANMSIKSEMLPTTAAAVGTRVLGLENQIFYPKHSTSSSTADFWEHVRIVLAGVVCQIKGSGTAGESPYCLLRFMSYSLDPTVNLRSIVMSSAVYNKSVELFRDVTDTYQFENLAGTNGAVISTLSPPLSSETGRILAYDVENILAAPGQGVAFYYKWANA